MTANNKALIKWNEEKNRYEMYIDDVLKAHSIAAEGAEDTQDTQEGHKVGLSDLCTIAKENRYKAIVEPYKADTEKREGE